MLEASTSINCSEASIVPAISQGSTDLEKLVIIFIITGTAQYVGRMQDFRWYSQALTNREIQELVTGKFRELNIQSNCLCPPAFPKVDPIQDRFVH